MWSLVASLMSSASGILTMLAVVSGLIGVGAYGAHEIDANALTSYKASVAAATAKAAAIAAAQQQANDSVALVAATTEAAAQAAAVAKLQKDLTDATAHIHPAVISAKCVPYGFVRVLYASGHGVTADSLGYSTGQSDDACAPLGWLDLAYAVARDYNHARANGDQLNALEELLRKQHVKVQ